MYVSKDHPYLLELDLRVHEQLRLGVTLTLLQSFSKLFRMNKRRDHLYLLELNLCVHERPRLGVVLNVILEVELLIQRDLGCVVGPGPALSRPQRTLKLWVLLLQEGGPANVPRRNQK